ncbi:ABC transporter ATP-binding protein [Paenibacillus sp. F411]|uniref:ABC transporter ATP-binding protein n=1 Tax=Paenibacillus sp. F411 TaxID=2820239 RepID=UPI001AAE6A58|nr:ABC transporter ATP-binding protein [Paenibacillus sp. F411]MBO2943840.1 ABC transporter ATP-binding protein [Paenibacillus sp. F411]
MKEVSEILSVNGLSGGYSLNRPVLHEVSFQVRPGEMVGLIGLNGAGKSTTMKHILGLMNPHKGEIRVQGRTRSQDAEGYHGALGFVPESPILYEEMTVREHLEFTARSYGVSKADYEARSAALSGMFRMEEKMDSLSSHLSKGMRQKVMIMCAFVARPSLYIIDEPFLGLDPLGIRSLLDFMVEIKQTGASILLSSHILSTIENYCERFVVLHHGRIIAQGSLEDIAEQAGKPGLPLEQLFYALIQDGSRR